MRRKIYDKLLEWKKNHKGDTALLIEGARRIGKSYIVEEFARKEYASYILVDFSKVNPQVMEFFNLYLDDLDMLFMNLELYFRRKLTPRQTKDEEARSLVIFDEVQFCPRARAAIKHLVADRRYDYIETGSLISIKKNVKDIMLPSEEHAIEMFPMDFEEFLWAMGDEMLMPYIQMRFDKRLPMYNPQIQISVVSGTKRSIFRQKNKTKRSKKRLHTTLIKPEQKVNEDLCSGFIVS